MSTNDEVNVKFGAETGELEAASVKARQAIKGSVDGMVNSFKEVNNLSSSLFSNLTLISGIVTAGFSVQKIVDTASEFELLEIRLKAVMGSAEGGKQAFDWIKQFAVDTPNSVKDVTDAFMQLKNFGLDPMDGTLQKVSDAAAKYGKGAETTQQVTLALGQAWARGKLQGQDTLQMINAGIPVYDLLSKATGKTAAEIQNMSEKGTMGRDVMRQLIDQMGREGAGAAADKMNSYAGAISNMEDALDNAIDKQRQKGAFDFITESVLGVTEIIPVLVDVFAESFMLIGEILKEVGAIFSSIFSGIATVLNLVFGRDSEPIGGLEFFINMLKVVQLAILALRIVFEREVLMIKFIMAELVAGLVLMGTVINRVLHLDVEGAKAAWKKGTADIRGIAKAHNETMIAQAAKDKARINEILLGATDGPKVKNTEVNDKNTDTGTKPKAKTEKSRLGDWKSEFEAYKQDQADYFKDYNEEELAFWEKKLAIQNLSKKEQAAIQKEIYTIKANLAKEDLNRQLTDMNNEIALNRTNLGFKVQVLKEEANLIKAKYGERSKEYRAMLQSIRQAEQEFQDQQKQIASQSLETQKQLSDMSLEEKRANLAFDRELGKISKAQELEALKKLKEEQFQIEIQYYRDKAELIKGDVVEYQKAQDQILIATEKHKGEMGKLNKEAVKESIDHWKNLLEPISSAFENSVMGIIRGTLTLRKAINQMLQSIALSFAQMGVKWLTQWVATQLGLTAATQAGVTARTAIEASGQSAGLAMQAATALKSIANYAVETFAAIYKSIAAIPFVGPFLAPAAAAGGMAVVAGVAGSIISAEGGYDIPAGINPLVQTHEQEMILPKEQANAIRDMTKGNSSPIVINTSGGDFIHKRDLAKVLSLLKRDFVIKR